MAVSKCHQHWKSEREVKAPMTSWVSFAECNAVKFRTGTYLWFRALEYSHITLRREFKFPAFEPLGTATIQTQLEYSCLTNKKHSIIQVLHFVQCRVAKINGHTVYSAPTLRNPIFNLLGVPKWQRGCLLPKLPESQMIGQSCSFVNNPFLAVHHKWQNCWQITSRLYLLVLHNRIFLTIWWFPSVCLTCHSMSTQNVHLYKPN